jgi:hypothetical protein
LTIIMNSWIRRGQFICFIITRKQVKNWCYCERCDCSFISNNVCRHSIYTSLFQSDMTTLYCSYCAVSGFFKGL